MNQCLVVLPKMVLLRNYLKEPNNNNNNQTTKWISFQKWKKTFTKLNQFQCFFSVLKIFYFIWNFLFYYIMGSSGFRCHLHTHKHTVCARISLFFLSRKKNCQKIFRLTFLFFCFISSNFIRNNNNNNNIAHPNWQQTKTDSIFGSTAEREILCQKNIWFG